VAVPNIGSAATAEAPRERGGGGSGFRPRERLEAGDGVLLVFGRARPRTWASLPPFVPTNESSETVRITGPLELAFPLHTQVVREYFTATAGAAS
jgi:hypothetical protein